MSFYRCCLYNDSIIDYDPWVLGAGTVMFIVCSLWEENQVLVAA